MNHHRAGRSPARWLRDENRVASSSAWFRRKFPSPEVEGSCGETMLIPSLAKVARTEA